MDKQVIISYKTVLLTLATLLGIYVVYRLGPILFFVLIALLIVVAIEPLVKFFENQTLLNKKLGRSIAVIFSYLLLLLIMIFIFTVGLPPVVIESGNLLTSLSIQLDAFGKTLGIDIFSNLLPQLTSVSREVINVTLSFFSNALNILTLIILSIYMSLDWLNIKRKFISLFPREYEQDVYETVLEVEASIGHWIKGQVTLMIIIGSMTFFGLLAIDVPNFLALSLIAGLLEAIPMVGPLVTAIIASVVAFAEDPIKGVLVIILFTIIQQLENNLIVPKIMQKVSGFSPLIIILAFMIGSTFFGIVGAVLAVPVMMVSVIVTKKVLQRIF